MTKIPPSVIKEAVRLLGAQNDNTFAAELEHAYKLLLAASKPRNIYHRVPAAQTKNGVMLGNTEFASNDLKKLLTHSDTAFLLAVTLGAEIDALIRRLSVTDMTLATLTDVCANAETERVCDLLEKKLFEEIGPDKYLTRRFSPGYGDLPLKYSSVLVNVLNTQKHIGLSITSADMLTPVKSVTAIIGVSSERENRFRRCDECAADKNCVWQKRGERCGL